MNVMPDYPFASQPRAADTVKDAMTKASQALKRRSVLATMVSAFLFCLILTFAWVTLFQLLEILVEYVALTASPVIVAVLEWGVFALSAALLVILVMPVWLGRLRLAGLICVGDTPRVSEVLYYYTSFRRLGRSALISLVLILQLLLPVALIAGGTVFLLWLYNEVLIFAMTEVLAVLLMLLGFLVLLILFLGSILLSGFWTLFTALAVGNEKMPVFRALSLALHVGGKHPKVISLFILRSLWHLLLSVVSFGVLYMYWYSHHYLLSYLRLSMALCSEKESDLL